MSKTSVWIDLDTCLITDSCVAGQVHQRVESALDTIGSSGPLTINVLGTLEDTTLDVLQALSSTGIVVHYIPRGWLIFSSLYKLIRLLCPARGTGGSGKILSVLLAWTRDNPPPAKILFVSLSLNVHDSSGPLSYLQERGYHILVGYGDTPKPPQGLFTSATWKWQSLLEGVSTPLNPLWSVFPIDSGEVMRSPVCDDSAAAGFICRLCYSSSKYFVCQTLEDFTTHLTSEEHKLRYFKHHQIVADEEDDDYEDKDSLAVGKKSKACFKHCCFWSLMYLSRSKKQDRV